MNTAILHIRESRWSGRARSQPPPTEREVRLETGAGFSLDFYSQRYTCVVTQITETTVALAPVGEAPCLVNADGSLGPHAMASPTLLAVGEHVQVSTWTLDMGATWDITLVGIVP